MSRRQFTHLSQIEIRDIVSSYFQNGETKSSIAQRLSIDNSTVIYHIRKHTRAYPEQGSVYSLVKTDFRKACIHPSLKCSLCGKSEDQLHREERYRIMELEQENEQLRQRIERMGAVD